MKKLLVIWLVVVVSFFTTINALAVDDCCGYHSPGNPYDCCSSGNCTWWAWSKRPDLPAWRGDAAVWLSRAQSAGIPTGSVPMTGSIACFPDMADGLGHVAYVQSVNSNGSFVVSEMGCKSWDGVRVHTYPSGSAAGFIYSDYASCLWHTQNPNTVITMIPGQTRTFTVSYTNTGYITWQNTGGVSNPNYIELRSCNSAGVVTNSWLYPGTPSWINSQRVVSQNATNVQPGQNAWFIFTGKVPRTAAPGNYHIYFRPYHATAGYIQNWGGMNFYIRIVRSGKLAPEENTAELPSSFFLSQSYPNPFNGTTVISYTLLRSSQVTLSVYNLLGQSIASLVDNQYQQAGEHNITWVAHELPSGVYFYRLETDFGSEAKKMLLAK